MIIETSVNIKNDGSCNNCNRLEPSTDPKSISGYEYPYETVTSIRFGETQGILIRLCDECKKELKEKL